MTHYSYKPTPKLADEYLALKAEQADLAKREKALREALLKMGQKVIEGEFGRVTIVESPDCQIFDAERAKTFLSPAIIAQCQKWRTGSLTFNVRARVADPRVAA